MTSLEKIIRPFVPPSSFRQGLRSSHGVDTVGTDVLIEIGKNNASVKSLSGSYSASISTYQDREVDEIKRETKTKRVTNPEDESQYVDVEVLKKLTTEEGTGPTYQKREIEFHSDVGSEYPSEGGDSGIGGGGQGGGEGEGGEAKGDGGGDGGGTAGSGGAGGGMAGAGGGDGGGAGGDGGGA